MKMNKIMVMATTALMLAATPITAFAQEGAEKNTVDITDTVVQKVAENPKSEVTEVQEPSTEASQESLPYSYRVKEDGTIVFSFNGEEYTCEEDKTTGEVVTKGSRLNVRTGAGMDFDIIDQLRPGEEVEVIGTEGDWYQITVPAKTGYVHSKYLEVLEDATNETDAALLQMFMMMFMDMINSETASGPLTPDGNMNLIDDYGSPTKAGKQFITLTTKNGNYFYLIIDRDDKGTETVHFMNLVDESDLLALMEEEEVEEYMASKTDEESAVGETPETEKEPTEIEPVVKEKGKFNPIMMLPLIVVLVGGGIAFMVMMKKKKAENEVKPDPDADYEDDSMRSYMEDDDIYELPEEEEFVEEEED